MKRWSLSLPIAGVRLADLRELLEQAEDLGYTDAWTSEADQTDCFTPLAVTAAWSNLRVGTAIANVFTRGPSTLASCALSMAEIAPGRFVLGVGTASQPIVESWNGISFDRPMQRLRDTVEILRGALKNERVAVDLPTQKVNGLRLARPVPGEIPIYIAALREKMLALAGEIGDGVIINWLSAADVPQVVAVAHEAARKAGKDPANFEVACRILVCMSEDRDKVRAIARRQIAGYLNVPTYSMFHDWLGRGERLKPMQDAWKAGDRREALEQIDDALIDELILNGSPEECREKIEAYVEGGVTVPVISNITTAAPDDWEGQGRESLAAIRALARR